MDDPEVTASLIKNQHTTLTRIEKFISPTFFTDVNLFGKLYPESKSVDSISHWGIPGDGAGTWQSWTFDKITKQTFSPAKIGDKFGPTWSTHWFKLEFSIPKSWGKKEVRLRWKSQSEAMVWSATGEPLQGLSTGTAHQMRTDFRITSNNVSTKQILYVEMVCGRMIGVGRGGMINPPDLKAQFTLQLASICTFDRRVYSLLRDLEVLHDLASELRDDLRGYNALYVGNQMINDIIKGDMEKASKIAKDFFAKGNGQMALTLAAIGNCHIDSAWLWPYSETIRKCARSWSSTIRLIDDYPDMVFACSQAQQFAWVKQYYPSLFEKIKEKVSQNKFVPVGSTWVEMDGLMPSGESFCRQFLYGQKFYEKEFQIRCREFWLPDTFGYSGQIPQICNHFDITRFLTQKLSWSLVNKFPNHSFIWEGIDGSSVLAHFPPGDSYEMNVEVKEALKTEKNLRDKGRVSTAAYLYGYGDGGGGPTEDMLERAKRLKDIDGCPKVTHMTPTELFERIEKEKRNMSRWVGELYLELHNGTYTSQAFTKLQNRRSEFALRKSELLLALVVSLKLMSEQEIKRLKEICLGAWKKVLLNQFHDVLPGSGIGLVYVDSNALYEEAMKGAQEVADACIETLSDDDDGKDDDTFSILNTLPWNIRKVVFLRKKYVAVEASPLSYSTLQMAKNDVSVILNEARVIHPPKVKIEKKEFSFEIENQSILASLSFYGRILKLANKSNGVRDVFAKANGQRGSGNILALYDDVPLYWDAWDVMDYHLETRQILNCEENKDRILQLTSVEEDPLSVGLEWVMKIDESLLRQKIILNALDPYLIFHNEVTWKESHKFLKVEFDTGLLTREASFDIQFGHVKRPTHFNTSWDWAKYETCGHKWADLSEYDCGLAVLNNCKYGWSARGGLLCLSLLRSPKSPDDNCDIGDHMFSYAVMPHTGSLQSAKVIEASYEFNVPLSVVEAKRTSSRNWLELVGDGVMMDAIKVAEDSTDEVVLRLHEDYGSFRAVQLKVAKELQLMKVEECSGMEERRADLEVTPGEDSDPFHYVALEFWPFQIKTIKLYFFKSPQFLLKQNSETYSSEEEFIMIE